MIITAIPTNRANFLRGNVATKRAATGAIKHPPSANPPTIDHSMSNLLMLARKPTLAETATMNSAALTVPIIFLGAICVVVINVGVTTGPQPPPPAASTKPPENPRKVRKYFLSVKSKEFLLICLEEDLNGKVYISVFVG